MALKKHKYVHAKPLFFISNVTYKNVLIFLQHYLSPLYNISNVLYGVKRIPR